MRRTSKKTGLTLTILGCGTSTGVPLIGCRCAVCCSSYPKNNRLRASAWVQKGRSSLLIDTSTDLRQQALREKINSVDAVLYTHPHADHLYGIDELRSYNFLNGGKAIPLYGNKWTLKELKVKFSYIFVPHVVEGGGIPKLNPIKIQPEAAFFMAAGLKVIPLPVRHGSKEGVGYRFDSIAYITDCSYIPSLSLDRLTGLSVLVLDCLRLKPHRTHFNLDQALEIISQVRPKKTFLTHMGHDFDYKKWTKKLPKGVWLAYDGLKICV
jgi:phosphoribosyl 1,2-cyclic phosphate phosphodiesterase